MTVVGEYKAKNKVKTINGKDETVECIKLSLLKVRMKTTRPGPGHLIARLGFFEFRPNSLTCVRLCARASVFVGVFLHASVYICVFLYLCAFACVTVSLCVSACGSVCVPVRTSLRVAQFASAYIHYDSSKEITDPTDDDEKGKGSAQDF